jgi:hypothetical protein
MKSNYKFTQPGTYPIQLIVTTSNNCPDTLTKTFALFANPLADFGSMTQPNASTNKTSSYQPFYNPDNDNNTKKWYLETQISLVLRFSSSPSQQPRNQFHSNSKQPLLTIAPIPSQKNSSFILHPKQISNTNSPASTSPTNSLINQLLKHLELSTNGTGILEMGILKLIKTQKIHYTSSGTYQVFFVATSDQGCPDTINKSLQFYEHPGVVELERATVVEDKYIQIDWEPNTQGNPQKIVLEKSMDNISYSFIDSFEMSENTLQ